MSNLRIVTLRRSIVALVASGLLLALAQPIAAPAASINFAPARATSGSPDASPKCKPNSSNPCLPCYIQFSVQAQDATTSSGLTFNYYGSGTFNVFAASLTTSQCDLEAQKQFKYYSTTGGWSEAQQCANLSTVTPPWNAAMWVYAETTYTQTGSGGIGTQHVHGV